MTTLERFEWVLQARGTNPNRWSEDAGLSRTTVRGILRKLRLGEDPNPTRKTLVALAKAANVSANWLAGGVGPIEPFVSESLSDEQESPPAPPVSATVTSIDAVDDMINAAFDPETHLPSDITPVREALLTAAPLLKSSTAPTVYVRHLLDAAARLRKKGQRARSGELPILAVCDLSRQLEDARVRMAEALETGRKWAEDHGVEPMTKPHPAFEKTAKKQGQATAKAHTSRK